MGQQSQQDDFFLLQALQKGNEQAFELLFNKYSGRLYFVANQYLNDREATLDIVQEVFFKVWLNHKNIKPDLPFISYLSTIAKNIVINQSKRKLIENAYVHSLELQQGDIGQTEEQILFSEVKSILDELIDKFPEKRKEIFLLSRKKGLSNGEIALKLNISPSTVENHINAALKYLRSHLKTFGYLGNIIILLQFFCPGSN